MKKQRFSVACAPAPNVIRRTAREAAGEVVFGFALKDTPTATMGRVTIARMIGMGREVDAKDIHAILIALASSNAIGQKMVEEAVVDWMNEANDQGKITIT